MGKSKMVGPLPLIAVAVGATLCGAFWLNAHNPEAPREPAAGITDGSTSAVNSAVGVSSAGTAPPPPASAPSAWVPVTFTPGVGRADFLAQHPSFSCSDDGPSAVCSSTSEPCPVDAGCDGEFSVSFQGAKIETVIVNLTDDGVNYLADTLAQKYGSPREHHVAPVPVEGTGIRTPETKQVVWTLPDDLYGRPMAAAVNTMSGINLQGVPFTNNFVMVGPPKVVELSN